MTIKFICTCGKHLKARDEMAARRSVCPRCGAPVGVPSLKPTHVGTVAAPMTPLERLRRARENKSVPEPPPEQPTCDVALRILSDSPKDDQDRVVQVIRGERNQPVHLSVPRALDPDLVRLLSSEGVRRPELRGRGLERHWGECLAYPFRAWRLCFGLALFLTVLSVTAAEFLPEVVAEAPSDLVVWAWGGLLLLLNVGIPCSFLDCVLVSATAGEVYYIVWSGNPLTQVLRSGAKWLTCFLAGPIVFAAVGWLYWLHCGEPGFVDGLLLAELGVVGIAYWILTLVALTDCGRLLDLNPLAVIDLTHRLGWRALLVVLSAGLLLLAHGWWLLNGVTEVHTSWLAGVSQLAIGWLSGLYWSTFFCRLLGVWCFRSRQVVDAGIDGGSPETKRLPS